MSSDQRNAEAVSSSEVEEFNGGGTCILTNIEAAPPCLLSSAAEADGGKGDVGHVGNLPPRRHRARYKGGQIYRVSQKKVANRIPRAVVHSPLEANCSGLEMTL